MEPKYRQRIDLLCDLIVRQVDIKVYEPLHIRKFHLRILSNIMNFLSGNILVISIFFLGHNLQRSDLYGKISFFFFSILSYCHSLFAHKSNFSD